MTDLSQFASHPIILIKECVGVGESVTSVDIYNRIAPYITKPFKNAKNDINACLRNWSKYGVFKQDGKVPGSNPGNFYTLWTRIM